MYQLTQDHTKVHPYSVVVNATKAIKQMSPFLILQRTAKQMPQELK